MKYKNLFSLVGICTYLFLGVTTLVVSAKTLNAPMLVIQEINEFDHTLTQEVSIAADPSKEIEFKIRSYLKKNAKNLSSKEVNSFARIINRLSQKKGLSVGLVLSIVRVESNFKTWAVSNKGAIGLMQIMPETGQWLAKKTGIAWTGPTQLLDPQINLAMGIYYLSYLKEKYQGNIGYMLAAYNRGPAKVDEEVANGKSSNQEYYFKVKNYLPKITLAKH